MCGWTLSRAKLRTAGVQQTKKVERNRTQLKVLKSRHSDLCFAPNVCQSSGKDLSCILTDM